MSRDTYISQIDGGLCDLKTGAVLRQAYSRHYRTIDTCSQLKACLRAGASTDLGGYPLYFLTSDGGALSFESVRENLRQVLWSIQTRDNSGWRVVACDINYEDSDLYCDHSGKLIAAAYSDD